MSTAKRYLLIALSFALAVTVFATFTPRVVHAITAALTRNIDNGDLAPFSGHVDFHLCCFNDQRLVTTVPAGKRLVLDHISYWSFGPNSDQLVYGALRNGQFGPNALQLQINPPHLSADPSLTIQDGSQPVKVYFEAGQEVWLSVSHNTGGSREFEIEIIGHYVTP